MSADTNSDSPEPQETTDGGRDEMGQHLDDLLDDAVDNPTNSTRLEVQESNEKRQE